MKEVIVHEGPKAELTTSPIPTPGPDEVVIRVVVAASNPKDWKYYLDNKPANKGDDMAGIVHSVGSAVYEFKPGDRVFALHQLAAPHGTYAEYAVAPATTTAHLAPNVSFHAAATVPLAAFTSALALYRGLELPEPWKPSPDDQTRPLLIYGASSGIGAFAVKLARASNIHPIIAIAGRGSSYVETLLDRSKGDLVLDYHLGPDELVEQISTSLSSIVPDGAASGFFSAAFDAIAEPATVDFCARVVRANATFVHAMPLGPPELMATGGDHSFKAAFRRGVRFDVPISPSVNGGHGMVLPGSLEFGYVWMRAFARGLQAGWLTGHPFEVIEGWLEGVGEGLVRLKSGKVSAVKYVYEVSEP